MPDSPNKQAGDVASPETGVAEPVDRVRKLELEKTIPEGTVELLGKDPGADPNR